MPRLNTTDMLKTVLVTRNRRLKCTQQELDSICQCAVNQNSCILRRGQKLPHKSAFLHQPWQPQPQGLMFFFRNPNMTPLNAKNTHLTQTPPPLLLSSRKCEYLTAAVPNLFCSMDQFYVKQYFHGPMTGSGGRVCGSFYWN